LSGRQVSKPIDAPVDVRQRDKVQENIDWRQRPGRKTITEEVAAQGCHVHAIAANIVEAADRVEYRHFWEDVSKHHQYARLCHAPQKEFHDPFYALLFAPSLNQRDTHRTLPPVVAWSIPMLLDQRVCAASGHAAVTRRAAGCTPVCF